MALSNPKQVEAFADKLTECADSIHIYLMKAIKNKKIDKQTARAIFQEESMLRQRANSIYIDAINCIVEDLQQSQKSIVTLIETAKQKIKSIKNIKQFVDLIADLLVLASAVYAAKPSTIVTALNEVKEDVDAL